MAQRFFKTILVGIESPHEREQLALKRAAQLAVRSNAQLFLFHSVFIPALTGSQLRSAFKQDAQTSLLQRRAALEKLAAPLRKKGLKVTVKAVWDYPAFEGIVREVMRLKPDLVVAESRRRAYGARLFLTNTDWQLIRLCPVPLLFVKQAKPYGKARVLAAVDPLHSHAKAARLDERILEIAQAVAEMHSGRLDVAHAYLPPYSYMPGAFGEPMAVPINQAIDEQHRKDVKRAVDRKVAPFNLPPRQVHVELGNTPETLAVLARRLQADVLVMGAVSRRGLQRLFIGSTAERAIDRAECDVLIVKPRGFRTSVPRISTVRP